MSWVELARLPSRQQAEELAFTLSAVGIEAQVRLALESEQLGGASFMLLVDERQAGAARAILDEELGAEASAARAAPLQPRSPARGTLLLTLGLMLVLVLVFVVEELAGDSESRATLIRFGASFGPGVLEAGQWWRTVTAAFLHIGAQHLLANLVSLFALGALSRDHFGPGRLGFVWLSSAVTGNWVSLLASSGPMVRAGASGGIFGLLGALIGARLGELRGPRPATRFRRWHVIGALLAMMALTSGSGPVDVPAHLGGLAGGALLGMLLRRRGPAAGLDLVELGLGLVALALAASCGWLAWRHG